MEYYYYFFFSVRKLFLLLGGMYGVKCGEKFEDINVNRTVGSICRNSQQYLGLGLGSLAQNESCNR